MFDSILKRNTLPKPKYGLGLCIALSLHAAALLAALWLPSKHAGPTHPPTEIILYKSLPTTIPSPPAETLNPPPPPLPLAPQLLPQELEGNKMSPLRKPKAISKEKPLEKEPEAMPANNNKMAQDGSNMAHPYSEKYGVAGGDPLTHFNPTLHKHPGPLGNTPPSNLGVLPFGEGMTPPKTLQHYPVRFSREALEARVEGLAVVRCTITVEGKVINCRFLQKLPYMDEAILHALYRRQYSPAMFQGKPISVDYNIPIRLKLP